MEQYIPKDALVAEIEKLRKNAWESFQKGNSTEEQYYLRYGVIQDILSFLNTPEVKEVKKDVWKDNSELPQENVPIIACCIGDTLVIQGMFKIINKGYKSETYRISSYGWDVVKKWAYMEELFPYRSHEIPIYFENELVEGDKHHNRELESHKAWEESLLYADRIRGSF